MVTTEGPYNCDDHAYFSETEPCPNCAELDQAFEGTTQAELLPAVQGFTPKHEDINAALVRRVREFLASPDLKTNYYSIRETWPKGTEESLMIKVNDNVSIKLELSVKE